MTNSSALSKAKNYLNLVFVLVILNMVAGVVLIGFNIVMAILGVITIIALLFMMKNMSIVSLSIAKFNKVLSEASKGNFDARITGIGCGGELAAIAWSVNNLLDQMESFLRETKIAIFNTGINKFFRKVNTKGLISPLAHIGVEINGTIELLESEFDTKREIVFVNKLSGAGKGEIENVKIIQSQIDSFIKEIKQVASEAKETSDISNNSM